MAENVNTPVEATAPVAIDTPVETTAAVVITPSVERMVAVVIEPSIAFANQLLQMVRDVRKALGREVRAVWMPPQSYGVVLMTASLPERSRDEVVSMGLRAGIACLSGVRDFEMRMDPPSLERLGDGSMLVQSRVWSASPEFPVVLEAVKNGLESTGIEVVSSVDASGGLKFVFGWIPGPCTLTAIPPEALSTLPGAARVDGLVASLHQPVGKTPMFAHRRLRIVFFDEGTRIYG